VPAGQATQKKVRCPDGLRTDTRLSQQRETWFEAVLPTTPFA
jgi:hypothetical protein